MVHVLTFDSIYKERLWGGRRLQSLFGRRLPTDTAIGEAWELADLPDDKSVVSAGPETGARLDELVRRWKRSLLGSAELDGGQFPLLVKFLDAHDVLSVQVHPDYETAAAMGPTVRAKYEAWYVIDADPQAYLYRGFRQGVTRRDVEQAVTSNALADLMIKYPARPGDWFYLPGGTVHALGAGLVVAEVQTPSDTTFRLYDWGRVDAKTGRPRNLHVEQALACFEFDTVAESAENLVGHCDADADAQMIGASTFDLSKQFKPAGAAGTLDIDEPVVWVVLNGTGSVGGETFRAEFGPGHVLLIPAGIRQVDYAVSRDCSYLHVNLKPRR